jgi:hypothetical protein
MDKLKKLLGVAIIILGLILLPTAVALSQDMCEGNFDYDKDVDGTDAFVFKTDFGRSALINPCPPDGPTPVPKTGQTDAHGIGDDGDFEKGVAWPIPRFTDNGNGTVTDNLTGLIWLKNANCFGTRTWNDALSDCNGLNSGECGLSDGSSVGDWRLPNRNELNSLIAILYYPSLPNTAGTGPWAEGDPFTNVQNTFYWSSTTAFVYTTDYAFGVQMNGGWVDDKLKATTYNPVWPVRGGR